MQFVWITTKPLPPLWSMEKLSSMAGDCSSMASSSLMFFTTFSHVSTILSSEVPQNRTGAIFFFFCPGTLVCPNLHFHRQAWRQVSGQLTKLYGEGTGVVSPERKHCISVTRKRERCWVERGQVGRPSPPHVCGRWQGWLGHLGSGCVRRLWWLRPHVWRALTCQPGDPALRDQEGRPWRVLKSVSDPLKAVF